MPSSEVRPSDGPDVAVVLVSSPLPQLDREFEYRIPAALLGTIGPGMRVRVPVRSARRVLEGYVLRVTDTPSFGGTLAEIDALVSPAPVLTPEIAALARAVADRQAGVAADVLRLAIPPRRAGVEASWLAARDSEPAMPSVDAGSEADADADADASAAAAIAAVSAALGDEGASALTGEPGARVVLRAPVGVDGDGIPRSLALLADIAAAHVLAGRGAILAVPDFRDVSLASRALVARLGEDRVWRADAGAKPAARYASFLASLDGAGAVVGTRSALYAPLHPLGAILVWDDGDESFVEPLAPYPHARDVALERQRQSGCTFVLASHAPSLEAVRLVELGWATPARAASKPPRVLPTAAVLGDEGPARNARIPSLAWRTATDALASGPVLVQVARPGYVTRLACASCREAARCRECGGPLRRDAEHAPPRCAVCARAEPGWQCRACGGERLRATSLGAGRTADELGRAFPGVPVIVADGEARRVEVPPRPALVVATRGAEPVTPGGYAAVLLLDGERLLAREALDAGIDTLRWWSNAAALARDGAPVVLVGADEGPGKALHGWDQPEAVASELAARRTLAFPPAVRAGTIRGSVEEVQRAIAALDGLEPLRIDGPAPDEESAAGGVVATVRFGYAIGPAVARLLKAELVRAATTRRPAQAGRPGGRASTLRVHLDAPGLF